MDTWADVVDLPDGDPRKIAYIEEGRIQIEAELEKRNVAEALLATLEARLANYPNFIWLLMEHETDAGVEFIILGGCDGNTT